MTADIIQEFAQTFPQPQIIDLPRMPVHVPDAAVLHDGVKKPFAQLNPVAQPSPLRETGSQALDVQHLGRVLEVGERRMREGLDCGGYLEGIKVRPCGQHAYGPRAAVPGFLQRTHGIGVVAPLGVTEHGNFRATISSRIGLHGLISAASSWFESPSSNLCVTLCAPISKPSSVKVRSWA